MTAYGYTVAMRQVTRRIHYLKNKQKDLRRRWIETDIRINVLIHELEGMRPKAKRVRFIRGVV